MRVRRPHNGARSPPPSPRSTGLVPDEEGFRPGRAAPTSRVRSCSTVAKPSRRGWPPSSMRPPPVIRRRSSSAARPESASQPCSTICSRARLGFLVLRAQGLESEAPLAFAGLHQLLAPVLPLLDRLPPPQTRALRVALGQEEGEGVEPFLIGLATLGLLTEAADVQSRAVRGRRRTLARHRDSGRARLRRSSASDRPGGTACSPRGRVTHAPSPLATFPRSG